VVIGICIGICRPFGDCCTDGWFVGTRDGSLCGNGKFGDDEAGEYEQGDRVGVLLGLDGGLPCFFKQE
jgi:hypothetical protein